MVNQFKKQLVDSYLLRHSYMFPVKQAARKGLVADIDWHGVTVAKSTYS